MKKLFLLLLLCACDEPTNSIAVPSRAFEIGPYTKALPEPEPGDWLDVHKERGQTFKGFLRDERRRTPTKNRRTIYLQPIGEFAEWAPSQTEMLNFTRAFFQLPTKILPTIPVDKAITSRTHGPWGTQLLTTDILEQLSDSVPPDAFCVLAVTMNDLYPKESWNFVFGEATFTKRVGVFSFARHVPGVPGESPSTEDRLILLNRSYKTLAHEIGHMFGIHHCTAYLCGMNGINSQEEADSRPIGYCPVCMNKLQHSSQFDVLQRYKKVADILEDQKLSASAKYFSNRSEWIAAGSKND